MSLESQLVTMEKTVGALIDRVETLTDAITHMGGTAPDNAGSGGASKKKASKKKRSKKQGEGSEPTEPATPAEESTGDGSDDAEALREEIRGYLRTIAKRDGKTAAQKMLEKHGAGKLPDIAPDTLPALRDDTKAEAEAEDNDDPGDLF